MDLVASCKDKLAYFRIRELKDVLTQLGLPKQGKKQDLAERILSVLSDEQAFKLYSKKNAVGREEVAKLVDDTYRKMQVSGASDLASKGQVGSDSSNVKIKTEVEDPFRSDIKVRCPCGISSETESMIKCEDLRCHVRQHMSCVIVPEKPAEGNVTAPDIFYCELCRLSRADPFWVAVAHPLLPVKLAATNIPTDGSNPVQSTERTFQITRADKDLLSKQEYDVQAWCMLLNDRVPFRMQWPQYADLQVNGLVVRAINRPGSQLLGANGRDDGPIITPCTREGPNKISLTGLDARIFCFGVRIVKRRTVQQILNIIPKEADGEPLEDALARVCRCIGGGNGADNADSDSDIEVVAEFFSVNLRCPMSGSRIKIAGRFKPCVHMGCFDLEVFVELNQRSRKWQCPICLKNFSLEHIIIDPYFNRITSKMRQCEEDVTEIEVKPDGFWRVKSKSENERRELGELAQWHSPDGTLCLPASEVKPKVETLTKVKQEVGGSDGPTGLKLGIRRNRNGCWEVSRPENMNAICSGIPIQEKHGYQEQNIIPMSSSATGSGMDGEDPSVNQEAVGAFDFANNTIELNSVPMNSTFGFLDGNQSAFAGNAEVILLSDSDEENEILISSGTTYNGNQADVVNFSVPHSGIVNSYNEPPDTGIGGTSCLGLFNDNGDDFEMPVWPLPPEPQGDTGFHLFATDAVVSDALVDLHQASVNRAPPMNGYTIGPETTIGTVPLVPGGSVGTSDMDVNNGLVDNPLAFSRDDPSLQIFLPTRPSDASAQSDFRNQADVPNGFHRDDWISLRLGDSAGGNHGEPTAANGLDSNQQASSREGALDSLNETASLLLGMNDGRSEKASRQRSDSPFSFPRQKRSVRPRLYLSIDSDSE